MNFQAYLFTSLKSVLKFSLTRFCVFTSTQVITRCGLGLERAAGGYTIADV